MTSLHFSHVKANAMYTIHINGEAVTGRSQTLSEAKERAYGMLDALSIVSHQTRRQITVTILDGSGVGVWRSVLGYAYTVAMGEK